MIYSFNYISGNSMHIHTIETYRIQPYYFKANPFLYMVTYMLNTSKTTWWRIFRVYTGRNQMYVLKIFHRAI